MRMSRRELDAAGITDPARVAIYGMENHPHFYDVIYEETCVLDSERMTAEILAGVKTLLGRNPDVGAILTNPRLRHPK